jgi:hypothetical protein
MSNVVQAEKKKRRGGIPIIGLVLAITFFAFSFGISTPLVKFAGEKNDNLREAASDLRNTLENYSWYNDTEQYHSGKGVEIIVTLILWFILMALSMFIVSAALFGTDPEKESWKEMGPSPANKKAMVKQMKKDLKEAKKKVKEAQRNKKV